MEQYQTLFYAKTASHNPKFAFNTRFDNSLLIPAELKKSLHHLTVEHHTYFLMMKNKLF